MSQSFVQIYMHSVFHTKVNVKLIREDIENELFSYLGGILKNYKSNPLQIGGTSDHIHIHCTLPKTIAPADLVEGIKKSFSKWINIILFRPLRGLKLLWMFKRRALPDVTIYKAYGLYHHISFGKALIYMQLTELINQAISDTWIIVIKPGVQNCMGTRNDMAMFVF